MMDAQKVREVLDYDFQTGWFTWKKRTGRRVRIGDRAGSANAAGYRMIKIENVSYYEHRLAWLHVTGEWPEKEIDHRDGTKSNNRWGNLRPADSRLNKENRRTAHNRLGVLGVYEGNANNFRAAIRFDGKNVHLGTFETIEAAAAAYLKAKRAKHPGCTI